MDTKHTPPMPLHIPAHYVPDSGDTLAAELATAREQIKTLREALESAFVAFGRAGGNTINGPFRAEWEACRAALDETKG